MSKKDKMSERPIPRRIGYQFPAPPPPLAVEIYSEVKMSPRAFIASSAGTTRDVDTHAVRLSDHGLGRNR